MSSYFNVTLDTLAPSGLEVVLNDGAIYTTSTVVTLKVTIDDEDTTGYQMKIWGVASAGSEGNATWETFSQEKSVILSTGDGMKTVYVKVRDDVGNETAAASDDITLNTAVPVVTVTGPDRGKISKKSGFDTATISFTADVDFVEYKVTVVPSIDSLESVGVVIPTDGGSKNTSGSGENFLASTPITVNINGADLETASSGDGVKIVKVFVKNSASVWSVA